MVPSACKGISNKNSRAAISRATHLLVELLLKERWRRSVVVELDDAGSGGTNVAAEAVAGTAPVIVATGGGCMDTAPFPVVALSEEDMPPSMGGRIDATVEQDICVGGKMRRRGQSETAARFATPAHALSSGWRPSYSR
jgi:hypothetical protein